MFHMKPVATMLILGLALAGCGRAATPTSTLGTTALPAPANAIVANNSGRLAEPVAVQPTVTVTAAAPEAAPAADTLPVFDASQDDPPSLTINAYSAEEASPYVEERTPYNVLVESRSAHTATISWYTKVATKGEIQYGRSWGFEKNGFTTTKTEEVAGNFHQFTLTELRRFTAYTFHVTAVTPLGLRFGEKDRTFRTKFWSWR